MDENRRLKGTLILPEPSHPVPAIIMIPGYSTGHRTRDEEAFRGADQEDSGTRISPYLAKHGMAVLRLPIGGGASGDEPSLPIGDLADERYSARIISKVAPRSTQKGLGFLGRASADSSPSWQRLGRPT